MNDVAGEGGVLANGSLSSMLRKSSVGGRVEVLTSVPVLSATTYRHEGVGTCSPKGCAITASL